MPRDSAQILVQMGEGTFGKVYECWDRHTKEYVAIKVVRGLRKYKHAAMIELEVLESLKANDPGRTRHNVLLRDWFMYRGHVCMVFERLGPSLFDFIRKVTPLPCSRFPFDVRGRPDRARDVASSFTIPLRVSVGSAMLSLEASLACLCPPDCSPFTHAVFVRLTPEPRLSIQYHLSRPHIVYISALRSPHPKFHCCPDRVSSPTIPIAARAPVSITAVLTHRLRRTARRMGTRAFPWRSSSPSRGRCWSPCPSSPT